MYSMLHTENASTLNSEPFNVLYMENLVDRLNWALKHSGLKKIDLARACGITRSAVSFWFNGSTKTLEGANLTITAKETGVNAHWLATGRGPRTPEEIKNQIFTPELIRRHKEGTLTRKLQFNVGERQEIAGRIPLISWVQAGAFCQVVDIFEPGDAEEWLPTLHTHGPHAYALRVDGDSMVNPNPLGKTYPPGCIVYVDPDMPITNGCRVIAKIPSEEKATFKVFVEDAGRRYLRPLNPTYPTIEMTEGMLICGVVVGKYEKE